VCGLHSLYLGLASEEMQVACVNIVSSIGCALPSKSGVFERRNIPRLLFVIFELRFVLGKEMLICCALYELCYFISCLFQCYSFPLHLICPD
jgi:hypothetical protein